MGISVCYAARMSPTSASVRERVSYTTTLRYYAYFRAAGAAMGLRLREECVFSGTRECPCELEADEARVKKKYVRDPSSGKIVGTWHYCVFGLKQRGSRKTAAYVMKPRYVEASSEGKPSPPPQPTIDELGPWITRHVGDWCVVHADGAQAYPAIIAEILKDTPHVFCDQVDHTGHQFTKFHRHTVPGEVFPYSRIRVTAGTNFVESWWKELKHNCIPEACPPVVPLIEQYVLSLAWRTYASGDPTTDLGTAVQEFMRRVNYDPKHLSDQQFDDPDAALLNVYHSRRVESDNAGVDSKARRRDRGTVKCRRDLGGRFPGRFSGDAAVAP